jgi:hypothetical protein
MLFSSPLNLPSTRFPRDSSKWPSKARVRTHFGQEVLWHEVQQGGRHLKEDDLEVYRQIGDPPVDRIFKLLEEEGRPVGAGDDLLAMAETARPDSSSAAEQALYEIHQTYQRFPAWADKKILQRGQEVYLAYLPAMSVSLYYRSLVPGFSIPRIAAVLASTGYLTPPASREAVWNRLMDTGSLLMHCFCKIDDILPGGDGWKMCLQVRFLHAKVRRALLRRQGTRAWDSESLGVPINEEDMNATLMAFAVNPLLGAEMLLGFPIPLKDRLDYLAVWRYLGWVLGVPVDDLSEVERTPRPLDPCGPGWIAGDPNPLIHSYAVFQSILFHLLHPNKLSIKIANHLLWQGRNKDASPQKKQEEEQWYLYRAMQCRRFVGDELADALHLPLRRTKLGRVRQWMVSVVYLTIITGYSLAGLPWSPIRSWLIRNHRFYMQRFAGTWSTAHAKRMQDGLSDSNACLFAMVAPPQH